MRRVGREELIQRRERGGCREEVVDKEELTERIRRVDSEELVRRRERIDNEEEG
jgi:hypothetical protein